MSCLARALGQTNPSSSIPIAPGNQHGTLEPRMLRSGIGTYWKVPWGNPGNSLDSRKKKHVRYLQMWVWAEIFMFLLPPNKTTKNPIVGIPTCRCKGNFRKDWRNSKCGCVIGRPPVKLVTAPFSGSTLGLLGRWAPGIRIGRFVRMGGLPPIYKPWNYSPLGRGMILRGLTLAWLLTTKQRKLVWRLDGSMVHQKTFWPYIVASNDGKKSKNLA